MYEMVDEERVVHTLSSLILRKLPRDIIELGSVAELL